MLHRGPSQHCIETRFIRTPNFSVAQATCRCKAGDICSQPRRRRLVPTAYIILRCLARIPSGWRIKTAYRMVERTSFVILQDNLGPYQKADDIHLRVEVNNSCEPKSDSTYSQDANQFLKLVEEQIKAWSGNRSGFLESLSSDVMSIWKIASNRAIGEWYARKFPGISDSIISKPADPKADLQ